MIVYINFRLKPRLGLRSFSEETIGFIIVIIIIIFISGYQKGH